MKAIFESSFSGHRIEYIYHVCEYIRKNDIKDVLVFGPSSFYEELQKRFDIPKTKEYNFFNPLSQENLNSLSRYKRFRQGYVTFKILKRIQRSFGINEFFLLSYEFVFDMIPLVKTTFKLSGIKYHINDDIVYRRKYSKKLKSRVKQFLFFKSLANPCTKKLYLLNNISLVSSLNKDYQSSKVENLTDPVLDLKSFFNSVKTKETKGLTKFVHIGLLSERKGTEELILALKNIPSSYRDKFEIIIAGKADEPYFELLQDKADLIQNETGFTNLTLLNKFLTYNELNDYFNSADFIILPYKLTEMSSGIVGHAINYNKPLIVPDTGFYKQLIEQHQVGFSMTTGINGISKAIIRAIDNGYDYNKESANQFLQLNSPDAFASTIINSFND